jgi:V/A-type H+-transporting ATPase subunit I
MDRILINIQKSGVVHLTPVESKSQNEQLLREARKKKLFDISTSLKQLKKAESFIKDSANKHKNSISTSLAEKSIYENVKVFNGLMDTREEHIKKLANYHQEIKKIESWGGFDPKQLDLVAKEINSKVILCVMDVKKWNAFDKSNIFFEILKEDSNKLHLLIIHNRENIDLDPQNFDFDSVLSLESKTADIEKDISSIDQKLLTYLPLEEQISQEILSLQKNHEIVLAETCLYQERDIFGLEGYIPSEREDYLLNTLDMFAKTAVIQISIPHVSEKVPVLLKNNKLSKSYEFILNSFSGLSYHEKDVTSIVAYLFMFFGSLCLMDAGYGLFMIVAGYLLSRYDFEDAGLVCISTGVVSTIIGGLNGQVFGFFVGQDIFKDSQPILPLATEPIVCFYFSLKVGLVAMLAAYGTAIWQSGIKTEASGGFTLALGALCYLGTGSTAIFSVFFVAAVILWTMYPIVLFDAKVPNVLWTLYSGVTGLLQDILSHMRLFGISLSGAILAVVVNEVSCVFPLYIKLPFCFFGHIFVFALALLSLYIHTNRLIFLEFGSKCISGGQYYYLPLGRS